MSGILAMLAANIIWGAAPAIFKYVLDDTPPFTLAFIRFFGAGLIFLPFAIKRSSGLTIKQWGHIAFGSLWGIVIAISFFFLGLPLAPSINVHIISSLGPIALYFTSLFVLKEKAHPQVIRGMLVSLVGVLVIIAAPLFSGRSVTTSASYSTYSLLLGNLFFLISMCGSVLYAIHYKKVCKDVHPYFITCAQFFIGALMFAPLMMFEVSSGNTIQVDGKSWIGIVYGVFFASALAYFCHNYALARMDAQESGVYTYVMPVVGVVVAIPLLGEYPDVFFIVGAVCIAVGIWVSERHPHFHTVHKKANNHRHPKVH